MEMAQSKFGDCHASVMYGPPWHEYLNKRASLDENMDRVMTQCMHIYHNSSKRPYYTHNPECDEEFGMVP